MIFLDTASETERSNTNYLPFFKYSKLTCNDFKFLLVSVLDFYVAIYVGGLQNKVRTSNKFGIGYKLCKVVQKFVLPIMKNI